MKRIVETMLVVGAVTVWGPALEAQNAPQRPDGLTNMQRIADALGVKCEFCHVSVPTGMDYKSFANPKKDIARQMIAMTREVNARVEAASGKAMAATQVHCATCHRGVSIPKPLPDILNQTLREQGIQEMISQYRELRERYYGRDTYDFREATVVNIGQRLADSRPDDAIALLQMNLEFHPDSVDSYVLLSRAYTIKRDRPTAIAMLKRALEIAPANGLVQGYLHQLDPQR